VRVCVLSLTFIEYGYLLSSCLLTLYMHSNVSAMHGNIVGGETFQYCHHIAVNVLK
jgi:hypothetical protein